MPLSKEVSLIEDVLADYRGGKMVILVDDENRENEGDLVIAAEFVSADDINFMAAHGRGLICLAQTGTAPIAARALRLTARAL